MSTETKRMFIPAKYAALVLPSSCSLSHPEIRYQGAECPLCKALGTLASIAALPQGRLWLATDIARAALSRPSSDPGAGEVKS